MQTRKLGRTGPQVAQLGLGLMGLSDLYGPADRKESLATIRAAMDAGVTLLDTGDFYGMGHNELLVAEALAASRPARLNPNVPIEDTVGAIAELVQAGKVKHIGLSEVGSETLRRAHAVHP